MDKKSKIILIISIISFALAITAVTYAYFSAKITGIDSASTISLNAGTMGIHYAEGNENVSISDMYPRSEPWITKTFTLTGNNTTNQTMEYEVGLDIITNTFKGGQLSFSLEVGNSNVGTSMSPVTNKAITKPNGTMLIGHGAFPGPVTNGVQEYTLKIYFLDNGKNQNINQGAVFNAKITVQDRGSIVAVNECTATEEVMTYDINYDNCMAYLSNTPRIGLSSSNYSKYCNDEEVTETQTILGRQRTYKNSIASDLKGSRRDELIEANVVSNFSVTNQLIELVPGTTYTNGQYTYKYMQEKYEHTWVDITDDGWGVALTDFTSNSPVTTQLCTSINGKPIVSMAHMFYVSNAASIDLSSYNTSNVTNMKNMFSSIAATTLDLSTFDTSNVTDMSHMFQGSHVNTLDLSSFDTSSVTDMKWMFLDSNALSVDLNSFDTSNVTDMSSMFWGSKATNLDLSSFDTSSVTDMGSMFASSAATSLNLSSFDTSSVTDMSNMFASSAATSLNLSSFDTSSVTNMEGMFAISKATILDLSSFNTSNVTDMKGMFNKSAATSLNLSSFDTSSVTDMSNMFASSAATSLNLSSFDTSSVTDMSNMFASSAATSLNLSSFDTSSVTNMEGMFQESSANELNLRSFDTSNVTNMKWMFLASKALSIDLSSFNTTSVINMAQMFRESKANILDLSSFDTSTLYEYSNNNEITPLYHMFDDCEATVGYARNETEATRFNNKTNTYIPDSLTFIVKTN